MVVVELGSVMNDMKNYIEPILLGVEVAIR